MLRKLVLGAAALAVLGGALLVAAGVPAYGLLVGGGLLLIGTVFERVRYKRLEPAPAGGDLGVDPGGARFHPTDERFLDDATGAKVTVWSDPKTGERKYVRD